MTEGDFVLCQHSGYVGLIDEKGRRASDRVPCEYRIVADMDGARIVLMNDVQLKVTGHGRVRTRVYIDSDGPEWVADLRVTFPVEPGDVVYHRERAGEA